MHAEPGRAPQIGGRPRTGSGGARAGPRRAPRWRREHTGRPHSPRRTGPTRATRTDTARGSGPEPDQHSPTGSQGRTPPRDGTPSRRTRRGRTSGARHPAQPANQARGPSSTLSPASPRHGTRPVGERPSISVTPKTGRTTAQHNKLATSQATPRDHQPPGADTRSNPPRDRRRRHKWASQGHPARARTSGLPPVDEEMRPTPRRRAHSQPSPQRSPGQASHEHSPAPEAPGLPPPAPHRPPRPVTVAGRGQCGRAKAPHGEHARTRLSLGRGHNGQGATARDQRRRWA